MHIDSYDFGRMVIDGKVYDKDLIILPESVIGNWWRGQGHCLLKDDLGEVVKLPLSLLVVGTGMYGMMQVLEETVRFLKERGINALIQKTKDACLVYNEQADKSRVAGAFHLTC